MPTRNIHIVYLEMLSSLASLSYAKKKKVAAIITRDTRIISVGYNGMPSGMSNDCEERIYEDEDYNKPWILKTKPEVIHAEANAVLFAAKNGLSTNGCSIYITMSPCIECAKMIIQSGISHVYYKEQYSKTNGLDLLKSAGIKVKKYD